MPRDEELPIIRAFYDLVLWLNPKIAKFPRDQRLVLSQQLMPYLGHVNKPPNSGNQPAAQRHIYRGGN